MLWLAAKANPSHGNTMSPPTAKQTVLSQAGAVSRKERQTFSIHPPEKDIFSALQLTPYKT
jgi:uracil DNA glycosylase